MTDEGCPDVTAWAASLCRSEQARRQVVVEERAFVIRRPEYLLRALKQGSQTCPFGGGDRDAAIPHGQRGARAWRKVL